MITYLLFDLDGTLADTLSGIAHFVNRTTAAYGLSSLSQDRVKSFVGNGAKILLERSFSHLGAALPEGALDYYNALYDAHSNHDLREYEGITPLLTALKEQGMKLAAGGVQWCRAGDGFPTLGKSEVLPEDYGWIIPK